MLTFEQIKELIEIVNRKGLRRLKIERSGFRLEIDGRSPEPAPARPAAGAPQDDPSRPLPARAEPAEPERAGGEESDEGLPEGAHVLKSPIVGTYYSAPSPDEDPYVATGDRVKQGQVLCIVEAMKLMNDIESDVSGEILEIYPKNAQPVEFGEPLFAILPD